MIQEVSPQRNIVGMALAEEFTLKSHLLQTACAEKTGTFFRIKTSLNFSSFSFACKGMQRTGDRLQRYAKRKTEKRLKRIQRQRFCEFSCRYFVLINFSTNFKL